MHCSSRPRRAAPPGRNRWRSPDRPVAFHFRIAPLSARCRSPPEAACALTHSTAGRHWRLSAAAVCWELQVLMAPAALHPRHPHPVNGSDTASIDPRNEAMSESATIPEQPPVRVWRRICIALGVLVVGLLVAGYIGNSLEQKRSQGALKSVEEELDENDPNWRLHDMEAAREMIPEAQNSAPVIMTAARLIPRGWNSQKLADLIDNDPLHPLEQLDSEQIDQLDKELIV